MRRRFFRAALLAALAATLFVVASTLLVSRGASGKTYSDLSAIPARRVGLVLGCSRLLGGGMHNTFFDNRIDAAARLFRAAKVEYLIVSGDYHTRGYDEPSDMKQALIDSGVPAERIFCDYAGFRTLDSVIRAREIFGQTSVTVISQEFHNQRAIFIGEHRGIDIIGFNAAEVDAYDSFKTKCREVLARAGLMLDLFVVRREPKFLGPKVSLPGGV